MSADLNRDYEIGEEIGRGRFGVVHRCTSRSTGEAFAVKSVDRSNLADDLDRELAEIEPKLAQLAGAGNPGVVQVHAVYEDDTWTHMVMDLCSGPDLLDWVVSGGHYGEKADVWSAGVVMYVLLSGGALPFGGETAKDVLSAVMRGSVRFPPRLFSGVSPAAKDLMRRMMCRDEWRRFSAEQVLRHPWIVSGGGARAMEQPT
uniref:Calcium-dependent protein kinase 33 n=1 Tax=Aegilops tauschii TaxID=37682 RepID=M8CFP6_AEGTA